MIRVVPALLILLFTTSAWADPYPPEVRNAFLQECQGSGGPEGVCSCVLGKMEQAITLDQLIAQSFTEEQITDFTMSCMGVETEDEHVPLAGIPAEAAPAPMGPECQAYAAEVEAFCSSDAGESMAEACTAWRSSLNQMDLAFSGNTDPSAVAAVEDACKSGREALAAVKASR